LTELSENTFKRVSIKGDEMQEGGFLATIILAKRAGGEEDMAKATLFLCSRAEIYINSSIIFSDEGTIGIMNRTY
jgi:hypothetical protein